MSIKGLLSAACLLMVSSGAHAIVVSVKYSGTISTLTYADCQTYSAGGSCESWTFSNPTSSTFFDGQEISTGITFEGEYVYDTASPMTAVSADGYQGIYLDALVGGSLRLGSISLPDSQRLPSASLDLGVAVVDGRYGTDVLQFMDLYSGPDWFGSVTLSLQDFTGQLYDSLLMPADPALSDFTHTLFQTVFLRRSDGDQLHVSGSISSLSAVPVPEPPSSTLAALALAVALLARARPRNRAVVSAGARARTDA